MIITKTIDDVEYPLNGHFRVFGYCQEKTKKQVQMLNDNTYKLLGILLTIEAVSTSGLVIYHYTDRDNSAPFILFISLYFFGFLLSLFCSYASIQSLKKLSNYLMSHILTNFLSLFATIVCALPYIVLLNAKYLYRCIKKGVKIFDYDRTVQIINIHKKYLVFMQCHIMAKLYGVLINNNLNVGNQGQAMQVLHWIYFSLLFLINMLIIQQNLKLQFILKFDRAICNTEQQQQMRLQQEQQISSTQHESCKVEVEQSQEPQKNKRIKMYLWQVLTYFESAIQMLQTFIFLLICVHNTLIATIVIVAWCLFSFFYCYQNVFELFRNKSGEVNTSRSIFFGYRVDYVCGLHFQEFQQLKIYQNISNYIKLAFVVLYKLTIVVISFLYFGQNKPILNYFNIIIIIFDIILFFAKVPYYYLIFFKNSDFSFNIQLRPNGILNSGFNEINKFNKSINIIIYNPIKLYTKTETFQIDCILALTDKMIYFEIYDQVRIYNKFGHIEVQIIKFSLPLYRWISTRVKEVSKSIRVHIFSIYNTKTNIISTIKDQLNQIQFDPSSKNNFTHEEVINSLPFSYFPRKDLMILNIEYCRNKLFSQIISFYKHLSPLLLNNPQHILFDLVEM